MTAHVQETDIERLARGAASPRVQRHLFACEGCLRRLIELEARMGEMEDSTAILPIPVRYQPERGGIAVQMSQRRAS